MVRPENIPREPEGEVRNPPPPNSLQRCVFEQSGLTRPVSASARPSSQTASLTGSALSGGSPTSTPCSTRVSMPTCTSATCA